MHKIAALNAELLLNHCRSLPNTCHGKGDARHWLIRTQATGGLQLQGAKQRELLGSHLPFLSFPSRVPVFVCPKLSCGKDKSKVMVTKNREFWGHQWVTTI
jgi:hypothetical protein